jgi:hypothetical protein
MRRGKAFTGLSGLNAVNSPKGTLINPILSFPRKPEPRLVEQLYVPVCAGMTRDQRFLDAVNLR